MLTDKVCAVEFPHPLLANTDMLPAFADAVVVMLAVEEVPVQPLGRVQL